MAHEETAIIAKNMFGDELYQQRARQALPLLVRQAHSHQKIVYQDLGNELGMPNARNLNYVLGSVGTTLSGLSQKWDEPIPLIQCLVVNKDTGLPGHGIDELLLPGQSTHTLTRKQREAIVNGALAQVFAFPKWHAVLKELGLKPHSSTAEENIEAARHFGGGESDEHLRLKEAIAQNPTLVDLPASLSTGHTEFPLPSGDSLDVLFQSSTSWIAVEVKSSKSNAADITRGLFQCVKYLAVLEAWRGFAGESADVRVILALEGTLPNTLTGLRNALGVELVENVGTG